jgi:uncharacterized protein YkwD
MRAPRLRIRPFAAAALAAGALVAMSAPATSTAETHGTGTDSAVPGQPVALQGAAGCASASVAASNGSRRELVQATLCRLNQERTRRGMRRLRLSRRLSKAARRHANDMVQRYYFSHETLGGGDFVSRIRRTGYLSGAGSWFVGENLAWGSRERSSADATVQAWMGSPPHRQNILDRRFREIGIGVVLGAPAHGVSDAATYATDFGRRS